VLTLLPLLVFSAAAESFALRPAAADTGAPGVGWVGLPEGTVELLVWAEAADGAVWWTAWALLPGDGPLAPGARPSEAPPLQGLTAAGTVGWAVPCGTALQLHAWALSRRLGVPPLAPPPVLLARALPTRLGAASAPLPPQPCAAP
jgi:hypothetical protein